ncbi:MAG: GPW/gp25 family protein [Burkholderiales bacterium]
MSNDLTFLGTGWSFPPTFELGTRAAVMVDHEVDIRQSLYILLSTTPGERVMQPSFGCGLQRMVFEHVTESTITEIKDIVSRAILFFEPRITLEHIDVSSGDEDAQGPRSYLNGVLLLRLEYTIRGTNSRANMVYPLYLTEGSGAGVANGEPG